MDVAEVPPAPAAAHEVFGAELPRVTAFAKMLAGEGVVRGVLGPREAPRLWERHLLNSGVLGELLPGDCRVLDVGSGAGLPGIPVALARPDVTVALLEPLERRVAWLRAVKEELELAVTVHRGRAEEKAVRQQLGTWDVVLVRAVGPLHRLAGWCLPLVRPGGQLLAVKGASAEEEMARDREAAHSAGGVDVRLVECGRKVVSPPTRVVSVTRAPAQRPRGRVSRRR